MLLLCMHSRKRMYRQDERLIIVLIVISFICVLLFWSFLSYRRQVRIICRHVSFIKEHMTNMQLYKAMPYRELQNLLDEINEMLTRVKATKIESVRSEKSFKETITNLSHDIRTPLTSLDGYVQLMNEAKTDDEREQYLAVVRGRIKSLKEMLEELFTYTKLQNDSYDFEVNKIDFSKIVYDTVLSFYYDFEKINIEPEISFAEGEYYIIGNEGVVQRVLQNIIKNALIHGTKKFKIMLYEEEDKICFCCQNGVTNKEEVDIDRVFTRFYKADVARSKHSSGLGLAIAKGFVERMNGDIQAGFLEDVFYIQIRFDKVDL